MVLRLLILASAFFLASCHSVERDNPLDPDGVNYAGDNLEVVLSSSSTESSSSSFAQNLLVYYGDEFYETVVIEGKTWFNRNLNYPYEGSKCYQNNDNNCVIYGRLYDWETANIVCPSGWHLPSDEEWGALVRAVGGSSIAGNKLKARYGWNSLGNGTDEYGFAAIPGGNGNADVSFSDVGVSGYWWSATDDNAYVYYRKMIYDHEYVSRNIKNKTDLLSVRCLQD